MTLHDESGLADVVSLMTDVVGSGDAVGELTLEHLSTGGKRLRARLALAAVAALGASRSLGVPWAAACELLHNATLVHDDLQDGDTQRRGQPTVWVKHGVAQAINVGDLLFMSPFVALQRLSCSSEHKWWLAEELARCTSDVVRGQAAELELPNDPCWTAYEAAVKGKTGALFMLPVWGAAVVAGRTPTEARELAHGFAPLGVLFQMQDDVLDLYGDKGRDKRGSDLYEGKVSCLVVEHLRLHPEDRELVLETLAASRADTRAEDVERLVEKFEKGGALRSVVTRLNTLLNDIEKDGALAREPALHALARDLGETALEPIKHVL